MINSKSKMAALEILDDLIDLIEKTKPKGLTIKVACFILDMKYNDFYDAARCLESLQKIKLTRSHSGNAICMILPGWDEPRMSVLSPKQRELVDFLSLVSDADGIVCMSRAKMQRATSIRCPSMVLDALDRKGFMEWIDTGSPLKAGTLKVFPEGDGPRGDSWMMAKHGRRPSYEMAKFYEKEADYVQ